MSVARVAAIEWSAPGFTEDVYAPVYLERSELRQYCSPSERQRVAMSSNEEMERYVLPLVVLATEANLSINPTLPGSSGPPHASNSSAQVAVRYNNRFERQTFSFHPSVVLNAFLWNKGPGGDAAGGISTWLGNKMRVIGAAGMSRRHLWPLVNMGRCGEGQVMLVAGREKVHFHRMPDRINPCLASEIGQSQFGIGRDAGNGAILEGQRNTEVYLSSTRPLERLMFFP